ncbi:hypothetical protein [Xanthomonas phage FMYAK-P1]|uniref:Uncharacterized protein n=1 Tax=Xanthomonas phage FMYAK-P1 TaxID=2886031 RepID=A0AAE8YLI7_9CAUD|nr:hypothetical protein P9A50_gp17 [Xanthomonas phage FMYAK-P1]UGL62731.1 hypothetical protein [Xanthomonas phage FMYAK-P1]
MTVKYKNLEDTPVEDLAQVMQLLRDLEIAPITLMAYATALDAIETAEASFTTVEVALNDNSMLEAEDMDMHKMIFEGAESFLKVMGEM